VGKRNKPKAPKAQAQAPKAEGAKAADVVPDGAPGLDELLEDPGPGPDEGLDDEDEEGDGDSPSDGGDPNIDSDGPVHSPKENEPPATHEQFRRIAAATTESLADLLADPELDPGVRLVAQQELDRRHEAEAKARIAASLQTPSRVPAWKVTKGGLFITNGQITELATGSVVTEHTHDLASVRQQGIELAPVVKGVRVFEDQLGAQRTEVE